MSVKNKMTEQNEMNKLLVESMASLTKAILELKKVSEAHHSEVVEVVKKMSDFEMDYTPSAISRVPITTQNEALEEIMLKSGMMSREAWEKLRGVSYDDYGDTDDDDLLASGSIDDEEFSQSSYSSYYERKEKRPSTEKPRLEVPNVETNEPDIAPAPNTPEVSPPQPAQGASEQGGVE